MNADAAIREAEAAAAADEAISEPAAPPKADLDGPPSETFFRRRVGLREGLKEIWQFREIILTLAERDLRARYKQALLGFAWALIGPITLMLVFTFLFTKFAKVDSQGAPYALFAYMGLIPWTFFYSSVNSGGLSLVSNMPLVNKIYCPREIFPIAALPVAAVDAAASTIVLVALFAITGYSPHLGTFYAPILLGVEVLFTLAVTIFFSVLLVYLRDLRHALPLILQFALFATPVAYGIGAIAKSQTFLLVYSALNPLAPVIEGLRRTILFGESPDWLPVLVGGVASLVYLFFAFKIFKRLETGIADIA
jgi:ABC-type polysaccharide/polyol phosphate export permease